MSYGNQSGRGAREATTFLRKNKEGRYARAYGPYHFPETSTIRNVEEDGACEGELVDSCEAGMGLGDQVMGLELRKEVERGWSRCEC